MRSANEMLSQNARKALRRWTAQAARRGLEENQSTVARRMNELLEKPKGDPVRTLRGLLNGKQPWRVDYLEAFCAASDTSPPSLWYPDYNGESSSEWARSYTTLEEMIPGVADRDLPYAACAALLAQLAAQLEPEALQALIELARRELEAPGLLERTLRREPALRSCASPGRGREPADRIPRRPAAPGRLAKPRRPSTRKGSSH